MRTEKSMLDRVKSLVRDGFPNGRGIREKKK
jgi:hypothetical protein